MIEKEVVKVTTLSAEETFKVGSGFGQHLSAPSIIAFFGDLGVGKTTIIRGIASSIGINREVCSPTFTYLNIYQGSAKIYHFDLYRLSNEKEFLEAGFDDFLNSDGICCIEWSEKIISLLPKNCYKISILAVGETAREISISWSISNAQTNLSGILEK